jgi:hypothetical protein
MALTLPIGAPRAKNPALTVPLSSTSRVFKRSLYSRPKTISTRRELANQSHKGEKIHTERASPPIETSQIG